MPQNNSAAGSALPVSEWQLKSASTKPDIPHCVVTPVANGYIVTRGRFAAGEAYSDENTYVARNRAELVRVLTFIAVKAKMRGDTPVG